MKLTDTVQYINSALNYPALVYEDIALFFDMAIAELNTTLHTKIPSVKEMIEEYRKSLPKADPNTVILHADPADSDFEIEDDPEGNEPFYYNPESQKFYIYQSVLEEYKEVPTMRGLWSSSTGLHVYQAVNYGDSAVWVEVANDHNVEADFSVYFPDDWILLWMIPYVCFKYTVRDGGTAQTFAEELTQGFQQLQESYDIPERVLLSTVADKPAYTELVEKYLPDLNVLVRTRAIYESMKHARNINAVFGSFYDRGGF